VLNTGMEFLEFYSCKKLKMTMIARIVIVSQIVK